MKFLSESQLNIIRGKVLVGHATKNELLSVFGHLDALEQGLELLEHQGFFEAGGAHSWRDAVGMEES